jgi:hypothetical protein
VEGNGHDLIEVCYYLDIFLEELRKITYTLRITNVLAKIRTDHPPNRSPERYRYTNQLGETEKQME